MEIKVLIERLASNGYQARAGEPFGLSVAGVTAVEALQRLHDVIREQVGAEVTLVSEEVPVTDNPWLGMAGTWKEHPLLEDWKRAIMEYRQLVDKDPKSRL